MFNYILENEIVQYDISALRPTTITSLTYQCEGVKGYLIYATFFSHIK